MFESPAFAGEVEGRGGGFLGVGAGDWGGVVFCSQLVWVASSVARASQSYVFLFPMGVVWGGRGWGARGFWGVDGRLRTDGDFGLVFEFG